MERKESKTNNNNERLCEKIEWKRKLRMGMKTEDVAWHGTLSPLLFCFLILFLPCLLPLPTLN